MKKHAGVIVFGILAVVLCLGFFSIKTEKKQMAGKQGTGMAFGDMMSQLSRNMSLWNQMSADEKKQAVNAVVAVYKTRDNVAILNSADFYVAKINETLVNNPTVANMDIMTMLNILAVMEYDYYNGQNKDELARKVLGEKAFEENQVRRQTSL